MRKTINNHFEPMDQFEMTQQNEFLISPSQLKSQMNDQKDQIIRKLLQKNQRLQQEILKINEVLEAEPQKTRYGIKIPQSTSSSAHKQLQNAYKQIRMYQYEIKKLRSIKNSGSYVEQIKKVEIFLKEKEQISEKLRKQLADIKKQSMDITKQLKNDNKKQFYENKSKKLSSEIKFLREKVKELEDKRQKNKRNYEKQALFIEKMEKQLYGHGMHFGELQNLKNKYKTIEQSRQSSYNRTNYRTRMSTTSRIQTQKLFVEDRTPQAFKDLFAEKKLYQKMEKDYQSQIQVLQIEREQAQLKNMKSRNILNQLDTQIEYIENQINQMKKWIDPKKIKPLKSQELSSERGVGRYGDVNRSLSSINTPFNFNFLFKNVQLGKANRSGKKFSDRPKLAKNQAKIVGFEFYQNKLWMKNIVGIQATYEVKGNLKKGQLHLLQEIQQTEIVTVNLFDNDDYFKQIECIFNEKASIIGLSVSSANGIKGRAGQSEGIRKNLKIGINEYPACIYGSFSPEGLEMLGCEILEQKKRK